MYKILIVDDEKMIRMGMVRSLPWDELNISEVYQASNGFEALSVLQEKKPDIMMTDINMLGMSGLELIDRANECLPDLKIIVLTGYDRFDYARECIRMKVEDLYLKPIDEEVLTEAIRKMIKKLEGEHKSAVQEKMMRRVCGNVEQMRVERLMKKLIHKQEISEEELEWLCKEYSFERKQFMQSVILLPGEGTDNDEKNDEFWWMSVRELCISLVDGREYGITFQDDKKIVIAFFYHGYANEIYDIIHELTSIMKDEFTILPQIVLGSIVEGFEQLYISYNDAQILIERERKNISELIQSRNTGKRNTLYQEVYTELKNSICANVGNFDYVMRIFDAFSRATISYNLTTESIRRDCFGLASAVYFTYTNSIGEVTEGRLDELMKNIMYANGVDACEMTRMFLSNMFGKEKDSIHDVITKVTRYIEEHIEENISVSSIAAHFYITPNYLSKLFKKMMDEGCNEYIVRKRIERARYLLETTNMKTGKIACMVGYHDTNYFSLAFKKHTGKSPTKYREEQRKSGN